MSDRFVPADASVLSASALVERVLDRYDLPGPVRCRLITRGLNDTYRVDTAGETTFLKVYRHGWRTRAVIEAEVALLQDLEAAGVRVAQPLPQRDGALLSELRAVEGTRFAVLFASASGVDARDIDVAQARAYGRLAAQIHSGADASTRVYARPTIDERSLIEEPHAAIRAVMGDHEDFAYLAAVAERVRERLASLPRGTSDWGVCHGDLHPGNVRFDAAGEPTIFDFDLAGYGWRAYDLSVFLWNTSLERRPKAWRAGRWNAFLRGYRDVHPLPETMAAVPLFLVARHVWLLGLDCAGQSDWLPQWLTEGWFRQIVGHVRGWVAEYPILDEEPSD